LFWTGEAASTDAAGLIGLGVMLLLAVKFIEGASASYLYFNYYHRWRSDQSLKLGLSGPFAVVISIVCILIGAVLDN
jgi:hypothetical protein